MEFGLARVVVPLTFHFPELVIMCTQNYNATSRVIRDKNQREILNCRERFNINVGIMKMGIK
jgi:hypothetical protein